ncbi:hypothetical protein RSAG8_09246, partial [Rhizoctonia solani AG-8 WAC10335]
MFSGKLPRMRVRMRLLIKSHSVRVLCASGRDVVKEMESMHIPIRTLLQTEDEEDRMYAKDFFLASWLDHCRAYNHSGSALSALCSSFERLRRITNTRRALTIPTYACRLVSCKWEMAGRGFQLPRSRHFDKIRYKQGLRWITCQQICMFSHTVQTSFLGSIGHLMAWRKQWSQGNQRKPDPLMN